MKCKKCRKKANKLYFHSNSSKKKWIGIVYFCFRCKKFCGSSKEKKELILLKSNDKRYTGDKHLIKGKKSLIDSIDENILEKLKKALSAKEFIQLNKSKTNEYCNKQMVKLYHKSRNGNKQLWKPIFWYCPYCGRVVSKV